jgi:hypothetical protein
MLRVSKPGHKEISKSKSKYQVTAKGATSSLKPEEMMVVKVVEGGCAKVNVKEWSED